MIKNLFFHFYCLKIFFEYHNGGNYFFINNKLNFKLKKIKMIIKERK